MDLVFKALNVIWIILEVLLIFNLLILVHEIGHFLAAKWRGLHVDGFGIWFGKPLWQKKINGVTYSLGSIPAGGFVKLPQMAPMEAMEGQTDVKLEDLPPITPLDKIIVAFAGPLFSFGLAFVFAVIVFVVKKPVSEAEKSTVVGYVQPGSRAEQAKFQIGDKILEVDGHPIKRFVGMAADSFQWAIVRSEADTVTVKVLRDGKEVLLYPKPKIEEKPHWWNRAGLRQIGVLSQLTPVVGGLEKDSPAEKAGLLKINDRILKINGEKLYRLDGIYTYIKDHPGIDYKFTVERDGKELPPIPFVPAGVKVIAIPNYPNSPAKQTDLKVGDIITGADGQKLPVRDALIDYVQSHNGVPISLDVLRDGKPLPPIKVTPLIPEHSPDDVPKAMIGIGLADTDGIQFDGMGIPEQDRLSPWEQIHSSIMMILNTFDAVISQKSHIGVQQMGGPVMMMTAYYAMLDMHDGWKLALWFSVILNVNLALINLLPIPVLDGGHIMLAIIEGIRRRPVNLKILETIQGACAVMIIGFMLVIVFYDVQDLPFLSDKTQPVTFPSSSSTK